MFLFLNYLFNCRETTVPWCPDLPALGSLPESMRIMLFGFQRALCKFVISVTLTPVWGKALLPWITVPAQPALPHPSGSLHKPANDFSVDLLFCWSNPASSSHQEPWWEQPPSDLPWAPWTSLLSDWQGGRTVCIWGQLPGINYRPPSYQWVQMGRNGIYAHLASFLFAPAATTTNYKHKSM